MSDWWTCIPEPFTPKIGFGMKVAWRPWSMATFLTMSLKVVTLSAVATASPYLKSISCCPGATSWCAASTSKPIASRATTMSRRASSPRSTGVRSK